MLAMALRSIACIPDGNVQAVDYDDETSDLYVTFVRNNRQYKYAQVGQVIADGFGNSGITAGHYFRAHVLNQYGYEEVT